MSVLQTILLIIGIVIVFFIIVMAIDCNRMVVREYEIALKNAHKDIRFVLLSDLHSKSFGKNNIKLVNKVNELNPDAILISGDMYTAMKTDRGYCAEKLLETLSKKYQIYYALGNHEQKTAEYTEEFNDIFEQYYDKAKNMGVTFLRNQYADIDGNVRIYGLEIPFKYYKKFKSYKMDKDIISGLVGEIDNSKANIMIAHNPKFFETYAAWGAELTVSGHVHGGLMRLPGKLGAISPDFIPFPKYSGGEYKINDKYMVLSCGLGTHHLPIRIFNPGEISLISIKKESSV